MAEIDSFEMSPEERFLNAADCSPGCLHDFDDRPCQVQMYMEKCREVEALKQEIYDLKLKLSARDDDSWNSGW